MKTSVWIAVWTLALALPSGFGWSDDEYAKIKSAVSDLSDLTTASGADLNAAAKASDVAMFYHLQGNATLADQWLAVAWQDYQQGQAQVPSAGHMDPGVSTPTPAPPPETKPTPAAPHS